MYSIKQTALFACFLTATSLAYAQSPQTGGVDGFLSLGAGVGNIKQNFGLDEDTTLSEAQLSLAYTTNSGYGAQLDAVYFNQKFDRFDWDFGTEDVVGHMYYRNDKWLLGFFDQQRKYVIEGDGNGVKSEFMGLEGQLFIDQVTLYGQLGQAEWKYDYGRPKDKGDLAALEARYFLNDNLRLDGAVNYLKQEFAISGGEWDQTTYSVGGEYRLPNSPLSFFAKYEFADESESSGFEGEHQRLFLGLKLNFGKDSLRQSDRDGAGLKPISKDLYWGGAV